MAQICIVKYNQIYLDCFDTPEEAAKAYNKEALKYFGDFAVLNEIEEDKSGAI